MKTSLKVLGLLLLSLLIMGMAQADTIKIVKNVSKVKATSKMSSKVITGLETYYGESIVAKDIKGYKKSDTLGKILNKNIIKLKNGKSYNPNEIEYALIPAAVKRVGGFIPTGDVFGPVSKAPHEQN